MFNPIQSSPVQSSKQNLRSKPLIKLFILCFYLFLLSCAKDQQSQTPSALTPLAGESCLIGEINSSGCIPQGTIPFNVTNVPGFPGCSFPVSVDVCSETDPLTGNIYLTVGSYTIGNHNCQPLIDSLQAVFLTLTEIDDNAFISRFDNLMFTRLEDYLFAQFGGNIQCGQERNLTISFIKQACTAICFYEYQVVVDPKGDGNGGGINSGNAGTRGPKPTNFVRTTCSTEGCCRRQTKICFDPSTNMLKKQTLTLPYPGNITPQNACSGASMIPPVIPNNTRLVRCNACDFACKE